MKRLGRTLPIIAAALLTLKGLTAMAAPPARTNTGGGQAAPGAPDRQALVHEILDLWGNAPNPVDSENRALYGNLRAALKLATVEQLLNAQEARTFEDVRAALPKGAKSRTVVVRSRRTDITPEVFGYSSATSFTHR